ncbi:bacterio-opsin activator domain-containing protein [Halorussus halobius]|uniref:bacterio-opsin activator domain-containing protein n=1 Tax=Halorussus halobius TaxID=1710537 RepID=UPI001092348D|nr:bacterio-opsin activator domain-containing protein [Halorussus halobius]
MTSEQPTPVRPTAESDRDGSTRNAGTAADARVVEPPESAIRVLYVDDADPPSTLSAADDVAVSAVPTGGVALDRLASPRTVDCVVSEHDLPETDGLDLLEVVRERHPGLPFVLYTDSGSEALASEAVGRGVTDYLPKSVGGERLRERVDRAVAAAPAPATGVVVEREPAARADELDRLSRVNDLVHDVLQSLVGSASREEIERVVCERLADSALYQFAWVGGPWVKDECTDPSVVEGVDRDEIAPLVAATSTRADEDNSLARVVSEDESVVVSDVAETDVLSEREREIMLDLGMAAAALVPLSHGSTNDGVLGVSGGCSGAFGDRELTALETLGELVSFAIDAVRNRNLLLSDTAVELEFRVDSQRSAFASLSAELDARFELEGVVPVSDDRVLEYVAVEGASAGTVARRLGELGATDDRRVVTDEGDGGLLELDLTWSGVDRLLTAGAVVTGAVAEGGTARYVAEASADADVRSIVDGFRTTYPDAELASKQEVDRPVYTAAEFRGTLDRDLTDKQRTALQTAYFAGYYEYPRGSTGEQVADSLGISSPTLHQHLQAAQRKLVGTYLDP